MVVNLNVGILGHVDSGKTTLAKALSDVSSTAAFDKNPQSQERGITLDLGFSALRMDMPDHLKNQSNDDKMQFTFVDCPGHASLIRTIIGGAQIIDFMLLVIDVNKGIQTQTAECIVICQLTCRKLIVVLNKIDLLEVGKKEQAIIKMSKKLKMTFKDTNISEPPIVAVSANNGDNLSQLLTVIKSFSFIPNRTLEKPFLFAVDHCFLIKGQGTICTGTILQGSIKINDEIEIPHLRICRKVKSMQMFRQSLTEAGQGDRIGLCITQFDASNMERGLIANPGYISQYRSCICKMNRIEYYKNTIQSKMKFHISIGHETVMANILLFEGNSEVSFDLNREYKYVEKIDSMEDVNSNIFVLLQFEKPIFTIPTALIIASKLDVDIQTSTCRLAFWGNLIIGTSDKNYFDTFLPQLKIYKEKTKQSTIQRVINGNEIIVSNLFKKEGRRDIFIGMKVALTTGELGKIDSTFGQTSKVKLYFPDGLKEETLDILKSKKLPVSEKSIVLVQLKFKKYIFDKNKKIVQ